MQEIDPQHQAVQDAAHALKAQRYWTRGPDAQLPYLDDLADLAHEFAFVLDQAGVTWESLSQALDSTSGAATAQLETLRTTGEGRGVTELALGLALQQARDELATGRSEGA